MGSTCLIVRESACSIREALGLGREHWRGKANSGSNYVGQEAYIFLIDAAKRRLRIIV
jgi:hypothetical protein